MKPFRAYNAIWEPTLQAIAKDGTVLQATPCVLSLVRFTAVPVYVPETQARAMIDAHEHLQWRVVGDYDDTLRPGYRDGALVLTPHGTHIPDAVKRELQDWCEAYARAHPRTPLVGRTEVAYQRNSYTTTHTCFFTYEQLETFANDCLRKYDRRSGARYAPAQQRID